jgi:Mg2+-importing ATPase
MTASSNFGNMFSMVGASAFLPFLPMLPIQLLVQNLLYDISQISIPWDMMDREYIEQPKSGILMVSL